MMRTSTPLIFVLFAGVPTVAAEVLKPPDPQRVLYVGNRGTPRAEAYARFLAEHFARVDVAGRDGFDPGSAAAADVVVLDWSQEDARPDGQLKFPYPERALKSPLGERAGWSRPTVLLGSAGHLLAAPWQVHGGLG
jgi:hypothetical protein